MRGLKREMERDLNQQRRLLKEYRQELSRLPKGSLSCYRKGVHIYYKQIFYVRGRNGLQRVNRHLGLLSDWGYACDTGERFFLYAQKGYYPGINLILTADDSAGYTDMHAVAQILDWLETICLFRDVPKNS